MPKTTKRVLNRSGKKKLADIAAFNAMSNDEEMDVALELDELEAELAGLRRAEPNADILYNVAALQSMPDESVKRIIMPAGTYSRDELMELLRVIKPNAKVKFWFPS